MADDAPRKRDLFDAENVSRNMVARTPPPVMSVSHFVSSARLLLERQLGLLWISGEVSGCSRAASGHIYFTLKDSTAQVRCVFFRSKAQAFPFRCARALPSK